MLKVLDLFSGIGGFSLGLERAGMETVAFCEIDEHCRRVLKKHWPDVPIFRDVKKLRWVKDHLIECPDSLSSCKSVYSEIDVICGGFPCQDISVAGKQKGIKGERSGLWKEFLRLTEEVKPRYVIIENVANLRSKGLATVIKDLWKIGYDCEWHIISARAVGAPHLRERIWIIAYPDSDTVRLQPRGNSRQGGEKEVLSRKVGTEGRVKPSYPNNFRLWKPLASQEEKSEWWTKTALSVSHWKEAQSLVCGVDDGLSGRLDKPRRERVKQLGNAVVPQIPELIGRAIMDHWRTGE